MTKKKSENINDVDSARAQLESATRKGGMEVIGHLTNLFSALVDANIAPDQVFDELNNRAEKALQRATDPQVIAAITAVKKTLLLSGTFTKKMEEKGKKKTKTADLEPMTTPKGA